MEAVWNSLRTHESTANVYGGNLGAFIKRVERLEQAFTPCSPLPQDKGASDQDQAVSSSDVSFPVLYSTII